MTATDSIHLHELVELLDLIQDLASLPRHLRRSLMEKIKTEIVFGEDDTWS